MTEKPKRQQSRAGAEARNVTIKDLARELELSITTISRALNGYSDVGEKTRQRVAEAAEALGYRPNRNAQRLVRGKTHNIAWVQSDNDRKFADPHFVEVMAGVLRGARSAKYDIVMSSETPERELGVYDRYVNDNSVDGFLVDLPRERDPRITYLIEAGRPFVVHGREARSGRYGWVDVDNYGNFYNLTRLMIANGHRHIAFVNGDERYTYAEYRREAVLDALADGGLPADAVRVFNTQHPMGDAGFGLTAQALEDKKVTAILYSSALMAVEGHSAVLRFGGGRDPAIATMDDELHYIDLSPFEGHFTSARSSLREAGQALISELIRQCETGGAGHGHLIGSSFHVAPGTDPSVLDEPIPRSRKR